MYFKPFAFGITIALATEAIVHKEQTPHPYHEHIQQDPVTGVVNVYQISGSTILKVFPVTDSRFAIIDFKVDPEL